ncbi:MAG TPA: SpoIIE family protein phosphatase [Vicinamibacterales bacterium]
MTVDTPRVLVADDQGDVVLALRLLLREAGLHVDAAASIPEVRAKLRASDYDLVLMDLNYARDTTSGEEGLELLAEVHADDPLLPVLVMTGWGSIDTAVEAMRRGACGFVHKPWDNEALTAAIRRQVDDGRTLRRNHDRASREQQEAQAIQRALLPMQMPHGDYLDIAAQWKPASTFGGDLYDVTPLEDGRLAISIGDVCGKGLPAALFMANVQASVRAFAALEPSPARLVTRVNHDLARHTTLRRFVTFFFGIYDTGTRRLSYCNAGHNPPIVLRADRSIARLDSGGTVLGALETSLYDEASIDLAPRDRIVLFTDGITEARARDDREFGDDALLAVLSAQPLDADGGALIEAVFERATAFAGGDFQDDATVVVLSIR